NTMHGKYRAQIARLAIPDHLIRLHQFLVLCHLPEFLEERLYPLSGKESLEPDEAIAFIARQHVFTQGALPTILVARVHDGIQPRDLPPLQFHSSGERISNT